MHGNNPGGQTRAPSWYEHIREVVGREVRWFDAFLNRWLRRSVFILFHAALLLGVCYAVIYALARGLTYDRLDDLPPRVCGLVLGCGPKLGAQDNPFFTSRMKAASDLFKDNKVQFLLVSGDNGTRGYDEPTIMKSALVALGVPANCIYCDYAGFRTLDSVVRAKKVFGLSEFTIISQQFHNERALYIARRMGLSRCIAYNAPDAPSNDTLKMYAREIAARALAILDVEIFKTAPKFLGEKVAISEKHPPVDAVK